MARRSPTLPVSPQLLKHFAAATVAITSLLALFAGGDSGPVAAKFEAEQARAKLAAAEQDRPGTKKIGSSLKVSKQVTASFGPDEAEVGDNTGGFAASPGPRLARSSNRPADPAQAYMPPEKMPRHPGESVTFSGVPGAVDPSRPENQKAKAKARQAEQPSPEDLARIRAASRQRSGSEAPGGE